MAFKKQTVQIYQSTYEFDTVEGNRHEFITCHSMECIDNIVNLFNIINQKFIFVNHSDNAKNEICIGGFMANKRVIVHFVNHFKDFQYYVDEKFKNEYDKYPIPRKMIVYSKSKIGFKITDEIFLEIKPGEVDYAFLIKLVPNDFNNECNKVIHILFGGFAISTVKATEYLCNEYKNIYRHYKNSHYFFALEINLINNSFNNKKGIIDLTKYMFK